MKVTNNLHLPEAFVKAVSVERPAVSRKCGDYCLCKDFCSFYKKEQENK